MIGKKSNSTLTRESILCALNSLSDELGRQDMIGEICRFGGTVMMLVFTARLTTKDVDAIFQPTQVIRTLAQGIAAEQNLSVDWLNGLHNIIQPREFQ